ncbi:MAG TPA: thioredoxin family protein [Stenomitos sp.]
MSTFHCKHCGRAIFHAHDVLERRNLWDLGDYQAEAYAIREAIEPATLRRYDVSLHEGWYCCRFVMMRMTVDKFGTGDQLLVYKDAVVEVKPGETPPTAAHRGAIRLTARDHDAVIASPESRGQLLVVKHGAIWCPPCRLMDAVIERLVEANELPEVRFFDLDIDENQEFAARFRNQSIPYTRFYYDGRQIPVTLPGHPSIDGGLLGGLQQAELVAVCRDVLATARAAVSR